MFSAHFPRGGGGGGNEKTQRHTFTSTANHSGAPLRRCRIWRPEKARLAPPDVAWPSCDWLVPEMTASKRVKRPRPCCPPALLPCPFVALPARPELQSLRFPTTSSSIVLIARSHTHTLSLPLPLSLSHSPLLFSLLPSGLPRSFQKIQGPASLLQARFPSVLSKFHIGNSCSAHP